MNNSKTIKINPELFGLKKNKTVKNQNNKPIPSPIINHNSLKRKLIEKIKQHKHKFSGNITPSENLSSHNNNVSTDNELDEFEESIQYLTELSNKYKVNNLTLETKPKREHNRTIKHLNNNPIDMVHLELPEDLKQNPPPMNNTQIKSNINRHLPPIHLNYTHSRQILPTPQYSCLKGGSRPTYRQWMKTQKNNPSHPPIYIENPIISNNTTNERERKLQALKEKIRNQSLHCDSSQNKPIIESHKKELNIIPSNNYIRNIQEKNSNNDSSFNSDNNNSTLQNNNAREQKNKLKKQITKKTIKRKYLIGKSNKNRTMSILIKDKQTKKRILEAHKELKKKDIVEIIKYLKEHGLIKVGTTAPSNVLRQMYENSMLAGDITNKNSNILLHNFLSEDEK